MGLGIICFSLLAGLLALVNLIVNYFWKKRWFGLLPILSYLCCAAAMISSYYDVAWRAEKGDISGLLDIYPGIGNGFLMLVGVVTVLHVIALLMKGRGNPHNQ